MKRSSCTKIRISRGSGMRAVDSGRTWSWETAKGTASRENSAFPWCVWVFGYRGAQTLFDRVVNALIGFRQESSAVGYSYM